MTSSRTNTNTNTTSKSKDCDVDPLDSRSISDEFDDDSPPPPMDYSIPERLTGGEHAADTINEGRRTNTHDSASAKDSSTDNPNHNNNNNSTNVNNNQPQVIDTKENEKRTAKQKWKAIGNIALQFALNYVKIFCIFVGILSIYWATFYNRTERYKHFNMLLVTEDEGFTNMNGTSIDPLLSNSFIQMVTEDPEVTALGTWTIVPLSEFSQQAQQHNNSIQAEVIREIHHQKYWAGVHINPNSTQLIYEMMSTGNYSSLAAVPKLINVIYESGRHFSALSQYVTKNLANIESTWIVNYTSPDVYDPLVTRYLSSDQQQNLLSNNNTLAILSMKPTFNLLDQRPAKSPAVLGPSELGLIYAQVFSFHQFNFSLEIYSYIRTRLKYSQYIVYRILASQVNCLVLSLAYSLITIAFQVPVNVAFGRSGFLVLWMFMYLFISASGGLNENVVSLILAFDKKFLIAPWMISNIVINISTTFAPFVMMPGFFHYGYAMPMYNIYEALKIVFFDTWKGHLGRNLGILVTWMVVTNILLVINIRWCDRRAKRLALAERQKKKLEKEEKAKLTQKEVPLEKEGDSSVSSNNSKST